MLDGAIRELFGAALAGVYLPGKLYVATRVDNGKGGGTVSYTPHDIRGQVDSVDERMRREGGYTAGDMKLIILQHSVAVAPTSDAVVQLKGKFWSVSGIREDAAASHWVMRGSETSAVV